MLAYTATLNETSNTLPVIPIEPHQTAFSVHISEESNLNPYHQSCYSLRTFHPLSVSTPRKCPHAVSMPVLGPNHPTIYLPRPPQHTGSLSVCANNLTLKPSASPPFSIKVQRSASDADNTSVMRPAPGQIHPGHAAQLARNPVRPKRTKAGRMQRNHVFWWRVCGLKLRRQFGCSSRTLDFIENPRKEQSYYFI